MDEIVRDYCGGNGDVAALVAEYRRGAQGRATPPPPPRPPRQPMRQVAPRLAHATYFDSTAALSSSGSGPMVPGKRQRGRSRSRAGN